jgi:superoxide dismutase, Cu-Zn family
VSRTLLAGALAAAFAAGCASQASHEPASTPAARAVANMEPTKGNTAAGTVAFAQRGDKVMVSARFRGLQPNTEHGFHVHEKGDCSSGDGMSAAGHFNPGHAGHGIHHGADHHAGDMPNVKSDASGNANAQFEVAGIAVGQGPADIVGKAVILHRDADDYQSQPAGNAGPRLACGVIRRE